MPSLFPTSAKVKLPAQIAVECKLAGNRIVQLKRPEVEGVFPISLFERRSRSGVIVENAETKTLIANGTTATPPGATEVLVAENFRVDGAEIKLGAKTKWIDPKISKTAEGLESERERVRESWLDSFTFKEERTLEDGSKTKGLRSPQIGALHSILGYWKVNTDPATVVLPTGTGKTETMLAALICQRPKSLLVVVPSDALREQISKKFITLGILKEFGIVSEKALYPVVGIIKKSFRTKEEARQFFASCNVVVTTMAVLNKCSDEVQKEIVESCSYLFIDEAHHIAAPSWEKFRKVFLGKPIMQFTATPYRGDGKHVGGKMLFNYPLKKAQEEGYFRKIKFIPLREYRKEAADETIAKRAVEQLDADLAAGYDHILMARASSIDDAIRIYEIYKRVGAAHSPVLFHHRKSAKEREESLKKVTDKERESRIIVCVDMFGEGFDLPQLKIAALHDVHKGLAITLQFTGRFTRTGDSIGDASVIANLADAKVDAAIEELYAESPADWNALLSGLSERANARQTRRIEFLEGFTDFPEEIPMQNIYPKMSTVVYKTNCERWTPEKIIGAIGERRIFATPAINNREKVMMVVTREQTQVEWGNIKNLNNVVWDLYLLHWDADRKMLFINSSNKHFSDNIAKTVAGTDTERIRGEQVFRILHGMERLIFVNLGLSHSFSRAVRFTMYMGSDVTLGLSEATVQNKIKSNLFGHGFEAGNKASAGASRKGRMWAYRVAEDISDWVEWCHRVGDKLNNEDITFQNILDHVMKPETISERPNSVPLSIEWSEAFLERDEDTVKFMFGDEEAHLYEVGLELTNQSREGALGFKVFTETKSVEYEIVFENDGVSYKPKSTSTVDIILGGKRMSLSDWFNEEPPVMIFEDRSLLIYNDFFRVPEIAQREPYSKDRIEAWDWKGVNIKKESQTPSKEKDSIQYRLIERIQSGATGKAYDIIFNDDAAGEAADVVAIKVENGKLIVHLFHCKFSKELEPGARIDDLYVVCGQTTKNVFWKGNPRHLLEHLGLRESAYQEKYGGSRFEKGDQSRLGEIEQQTDTLDWEFKAFIVQPGLSKNAASQAQLDLLASTELYLKETYQLELGVIASA